MIASYRPASIEHSNQITTTHRPVIRTAPRPDCLLCGTPGRPLHQGLTDRVFGVPGDWHLAQCADVHCGLIWLDPLPLEADIGAAYRDYYTHGPAGRRGFAATLLNGLLGLTRAQRRVNDFYLADTTSGRLLEIGFGAGHRMARMAALGWTVMGQEVDPVALDHARQKGFDVRLGPLPGLKLDAGHYDAIVGSHVIEHLHDPVGILRECKRLLREDGRVIMITPNTASYGHREFRQHWIGLDPPRHIHLFNPVTMARLARLAGFTRFDITTTPAHASTFVRTSINLSTSAVGDVLTHTSRVVQLRVAARVIAARARFLWDRECGEELVLQAWCH